MKTFALIDGVANGIVWHILSVKMFSICGFVTDLTPATIAS